MGKLPSVNDHMFCVDFVYIRYRNFSRSQPLRVSRNTPCSPNKFQNHHGALSRNGAPHALSATDFSTFTPATRQSSRKSLMVQKWMLGESYQLSGRLSVTGIA